MIMTLASLCLALEVMSLRRSFFRMTRKEDRHHTITQPLRDLWQNKWLSGTIVLAFVISVLSLYIPGVNRRLFKHAPIDLEWAVVVVLMTIWFLFVEGYKWGVRKFYRKREMGKGDMDDLEARAFRTWIDRDSMDVEVVDGKE
jgi:magnesium-transporting ATPase (P-type)